MIRTAYPIPRFSPLRQARLRLDAASRRTRRALQTRRLNKAVASTAFLTPPPSPSAIIAPSTEPLLWEEKAALGAFYDRFDELTGLICVAAQEGVSITRENRYQAARTWLMEVYPAGIQQGVAPYLISAVEAQCDADPFACFWTPPTLTDLLQNDDGTLTERMELTLNVLATWENALRARLAPRHN